VSTTNPCGYFTSPGTYVSTSDIGGFAKVVSDGSPSLVGTASVSSDTGATAEISLYYWVELVGPSAGPVPVDFSYSASAQSNLGGEAFSYLEINGVQLVNFQSINGVGSETISTTGSLMILPGTLFDVNMSIMADASGLAGGHSLASVDPYFFVDPTFPGAADYTILTSPGIDNLPTAVPEPSAWALMLVGFAGLSYAGYRRNARLA
jgi:hypothetical protein